MNQQDKVLVFGATGNIGGAAARELLGRGWQVRAVTRNPQSEKARALAVLGAEVVQGDMDDRGSLEAVFEGMRRVFSVQNWVTSGTEGEIRQGKLVADIARSVGVEHLVYGSAGTGDPHTGVPHFDSKLIVEAYLHTLGIPFTIVRPGPFMELLSQKEFYPALGVWGTQTKILGWEAPIPWVAVRDIGTAIANIFADPVTWIGQDVTLIGDVKSMRECRDVFLAANGKRPFGLPLPPWLFQKMAGEEWIIMWRWLKDLVAEVGRPGLWQMAKGSRQVCPDMLDLRGWLEQGQEHARYLASKHATPGQQQEKRATGST